MSNYLIESADKAELGPQTWRIVRDRKIFLRVLKTKGSQKSKYPYELVTATASDNRGNTIALSNHERLTSIKAAKKTSIDLLGDGDISLQYDWKGREYICICLASADFFDNGVEEVINNFFLNYDALIADTKESDRLPGNDLIGLYRDLHVEDGEAVYLSDGMWLTPDGRLIEK